MKFFKNPLVAVLLSLLLIVGSTLLSVHLRFGAKADAISDGFYEGVYANGYKQPSIASHLENISGAADGLVTIARNYEIDATVIDQVSDANDDLKMSLSYSGDEVDWIYYTYSELMPTLHTLIDQLERAELSERDASGVSQYSSTINGAQSSISSAGYNESVREFLRKYDRFPTSALASIANVDMPQYFA